MKPRLLTAGARRRRGPYRRWSAAEVGEYLATFRRSGLSGEEFCRRMGVPCSTFARWKRSARRVDAESAAAAVPVTFASVALVEPTVADVTTNPAAPGMRGMRVYVRGTTGQVAAIEGVDRATALAIVGTVLGVLRGER